MELKEYIRLVLEEMPDKAKVSFDIGVKQMKGKLFVDTYGSNKVKFTVTRNLGL